MNIKQNTQHSFMEVRKRVTMGKKIQKTQQIDGHNTIVEKRFKLMISTTMDSDGVATSRDAHFLQPSLNPITEARPIRPSPPSFPSSNSNKIKKLTKIVSFKGRPKPQYGWKTWVDDLQKTHQNIWKKVGIFDAIRGSTYKILRDNELVVSLAEKWCPETNTFVFSWGESTITLEDVMILGGFSVLGYSVVNPSYCKQVEKLEKKMVDSFAEIRRRNKNQVSHYAWMAYFMGEGGELEHVALLVLWLSRYVFSTNHYNTISKNLFKLAINLAMGTQFALAPAVLAAIYRDLRLVKQNIEHCRTLDVWGLFQLVQLWAWERFPGLSPRPTPLARGEPRVARWHDIHKLKIKNLKQEIESAGNNFCWKPYALSVSNWEFPKFYCEQGRMVVLNSEEDEQLWSYARCLRSSELVGVDCVEQYLPHRVGMQFGLDQDIPRQNADSELAWDSYCKPLDGLKLYSPPRLSEGDVTVDYADWWCRKLIGPREDVDAEKHEYLAMEEEEENKMDSCINAEEIEYTLMEQEEVNAMNKDDAEESEYAAIREEEVNAANKDDDAEAYEYTIMEEEEVNALIKDDAEEHEYTAMGKEENKVNHSIMNKDDTEESEYYAMEEQEVNKVDHSIMEKGDTEEIEYSVMEEEEVNMVDHSFMNKDDTEEIEYIAMEEEEVNKMPNDKSSFGESIKRQIVENEAFETEPVEVVNLGEGRKYSEGACSPDKTITEDNEILIGEGPSIAPEMNVVLGEHVEDIQQNTKEDADTKKLKTSVDDIVVISDEEDDPHCNPFEELFKDFETRMNRLNKLVSALKAAKSKAMTF